MITTVKEWKQFKLNEKVDNLNQRIAKLEGRRINESNLVEYTLEDYFRNEKIRYKDRIELKELNLYNKKITSLEGIENCTKLTWLSVGNNKLTTLTGIEKCINLKYLYCYNNQLTSLKGIENLSKLEELNCNNNQLTSLKGIKHLSKLEYLDCDDNQLPLNNYKNMKVKKIQDSL
jgi:Leucine-rich repeat (LRR) protein